MLTIVLPETEDQPPLELHLEHSLVSLSKWESIHEKVFFGREEKTHEESISYIKCMIINDSFPANVLERFTAEHVEQVGNYINGKHTATTFREDQSARKSNEVITSELVYFWLIQFQIPFSCDTWNFNRLMTLISICGIKQAKPKKMNKQEWAAQQRALNEQRRNSLGTRG